MASIFGNIWDTEQKKKEVTSSRQDKTTLQSPRAEANAGGSIFGDVFGARDRKAAEDAAGSKELMKVVRPLEYTTDPALQPATQPKQKDTPGLFKTASNIVSNAEDAIGKGIDRVGTAIDATKAAGQEALDAVTTDHGEWITKQTKDFMAGVGQGLFGMNRAMEGSDALKNAMNTPTGKKIINAAADTSSNLYSKYVSALQGDYAMTKAVIQGNAKTFAQMNDAYDQAYQLAYSARMASKNDPNNSAFHNFMEQVGDSGAQSLVGVLLGMGVTYLTKSPQLGIAVTAPFYAALSAQGQLQSKGNVYSMTDIGIDTLGDELLNTMLLGIMKTPATAGLKLLVESQAEGLTEVAQSLLKYSNDYIQAENEDERKKILDQAKQYVTSGNIAMEYGVGSFVGLFAGGVAAPIQASSEYEAKKAAYDQGVASLDSNIKNNEAYTTQLDKYIEAGDMPADRVYSNQETKTLTEQVANGRINDIAQNMERAGMPAESVKEFRTSIDAKNTTISEIVDAARTTLSGFKPPVLNNFSVDNPNYVSQKEALKEKKTPRFARPVESTPTVEGPAAVTTEETPTENTDAQVIRDRDALVNPGENVDTTKAQDRINDYANLYSTRNVFVPNISANGQPIVSISTVPFPDGKFAVKYVANAGDLGMNVGYDYSKLYDSADEAVRAATNRIILWAKTEQTSNLEPSVRSQLDAVIDYAQNPREPLSPAAIQRIADEGKAKKRAPKADNTPIATPANATPTQNVTATMTKSAFDKETKGLFNEVRVVNGITIGRVAWHDKPWKILEAGTTFEQAKERGYTPIGEFRTRDDLWDVYKKAFAKVVTEAKKNVTIKQDNSDTAKPLSEVEGMRRANPELYNAAVSANSEEAFIEAIAKGKPESVDAEALRTFYNKVKPTFARALQNANIQMYRAGMRAHTLDEFIADMRKKTGDKYSDADLEESYHKIKGNQPDLALEKKNTESAKNAQAGYASSRATIIDLQKGKLTVSQYRQAYKDLLKNESKIKADLLDMPKEELLKHAGRFTTRSGASKTTLANNRYDGMIMAYALGKSVSFVLGEGSSEQAIQKIVDNATLDDLMAYKDRIAEQQKRYADFVAETKRAITDPQTLEDFRKFIEVKGEDKLTAEQRIKYDDLLAARSKDKAAKTAENKGIVSGVKADTEMVIQQTKHTKTGEDLYVVTMKDRVERDVYKELNARAKKLGGWYSMFRGAGAIPGFQFKSQEAAEQFIQVGKGETVKTGRFVEKASTQKENNASKLRKVADNLEEKATEKLNADRKTNTARRASMASGVEAQARNDIAMAKTMRNIADAVERGDGLLLGNISAKTQIEELDTLLRTAKYREARENNYKRDNNSNYEPFPVTEKTYEYVDHFPFKYYHVRDIVKKGMETRGAKRIAAKVHRQMTSDGEYTPRSLAEADEFADMADAVNESRTVETYKRMRALGVDSTATLRSLLREYTASQVSPEEADKVKQLERNLIGKKVGIDFFPTPKSVAAQMVSEADIVGGMRVLEPSAGNGNIAEVIRDEAGVDPYVMEISGDLRKVLEAKGFDVIGQDFMEENGMYDRIVMNPPFSNHQDIQHVRHAYELLNPGGKVVAIMGEGAFSRSQKEDVAFREWLDKVGGSSEKLPEGTFKDADLLANTGTNARIVTISKQEAPVVAQDPTGDYESSKVVQDARDNTLTIVVEDLDETIEASFGGFKRELIAEMNERITTTPEGTAMTSEHGEIVNFTIKKNQMKSIIFKDGFSLDQNFKQVDVEREYEKAKKLATKKVALSTGTVSRPEQLVTKTALKDILMGEERIEFTVGHDATGKYLAYTDDTSSMRLKPSALGLVDENLQEFQTVVLDASELKKKGTALRAKNAQGQVMAEPVSKNPQTPDLKKYSASYLDYKPNGTSGKEHFIYAIPLEEREAYFGAVDGYTKDKDSMITVKGSDDVQGEGIWHITATPFERLIEAGAEYRGVASKEDLELILDNQEQMADELEKKLGRPLNLVYDQGAVDQQLKLDDEIRASRMQTFVQGRDTRGRFTAEKERLAVSTQANQEYEEVSRRVQRAEPEGQKPSILLNREPNTPSELAGSSQIDEKVLSDPKSPEWKEQSQALVRRQEIARVLAEKLNMTVRRGKFRQKASGVYKPDQNVVRLSKKAFSPRVGGQITTLFHETGHFIDYTVHKFRRIIPKTEVAPLLAEYGAGPDSVPLAKRRSEAFAEFVRLYLTQPEKAKKTAPLFHQLFETTMQAYPEVRDALMEAQSSFTRWKDQPSAAKVLSQISFEQKDPRTLKKRMSYRLHQFYQHAVDDLHPLEQFVETATKGKEIATEVDPYKLARNLRGWIGRANTFLEFGTIGRNYWQDGKVVYKGKSLKAILQNTDDAGALPDLSTYLVSKRTIALAERDITSGITVADAQATIRELEQKYPDFQNVAKEIEKYQDQVMEYVIQSGLIKASDANAMKQANRDYVPFFRVVQELEQGGYMGGKGIPNTKNLFKKIKGSELEIIDPIESIVKNTYALINAAERNNVLLTMAMMAEKNKDVGPLFERVPGDMSLSAKVNARDIVYQALGATSDIAKAFLPVDTQMAVEQHVPDSMVNIFRPSMFQKGNVVTVMDAGVAKHYVAEEDLYKALNAMEVEDVAMFIKILSYPAQFLRAGATLTPEFMLRNPVRDTFSAAIYSRHGFTPVWDTLRGFAELIKKGDVYHAWLIEGGELASIVSQDRETMRQNHKELMQRSEKLKKFIKNPLEVLRLVSAYSEQATRLGEARLALARGKSPQEAAFASREVTLDFMRSGAKMRTLNKLAAFFNAVVQGDDKMLRSFKTNPARTASKTLLAITLPSIVLYMLNRDEDGWDEIPQWQKDLFWLVHVDGVWYRIPKPFELGLLFGSLPERMLEYMDKKDPESMREVAHTIIQGTLPGFMPTAMTPIVENITNYSFFLDRPIVSQGMTNLPPEEQYTQNTSEIAKITGKTIGYSPAKIENLVRGYFAGIGTYAMQATDKVLMGTGIIPKFEKPAATGADIVGLKAFVVRDPVGSSGVSVDRFYKKRDESVKAYNHVKDLAEAGNREKASAYLREHPEARLHSEYESLARTLSEIRKARKAVYESDTLTAEQKRDKIAELDKVSTDVAQKGLTMQLK